MSEAELEESYRALAADEAAEREATEWLDGVGSDVGRLLGSGT